MKGTYISLDVGGLSISCYLCYKIISIDEFEKITFCKYFDIDLKDE